MENSRPAPPVGIRLLWWFGIYLTAQVPLVPQIYRYNREIWFLFPRGLEWPFFILTAGFVPHPNPTTYAGWQLFVRIVDSGYTILMAVFPWAIYAINLIFSMCVRTRRNFMILLWILGAIVVFNLGSCASFLHSPPE